MQTRYILKAQPMKNKLQKILFQYNGTQESENKIEKFFENEIKKIKND